MNVARRLSKRDVPYFYRSRGNNRAVKRSVLAIDRFFLATNSFILCHGYPKLAEPCETRFSRWKLIGGRLPARSTLRGEVRDWFPIGRPRRTRRFRGKNRESPRDKVRGRLSAAGREIAWRRGSERPA